MTSANSAADEDTCDRKRGGPGCPPRTADSARLPAGRRAGRGGRFLLCSSFTTEDRPVGAPRPRGSAHRRGQSLLTRENFISQTGATRPDVDDALGTSRSRRFPSGPRHACGSSPCSRETPQVATCTRGRRPPKGTHTASQRPPYNIDWHQPVSRIMEIM